jgi:hypothetical protein
MDAALLHLLTDRRLVLRLHVERVYGWTGA